jgi:hypothetical protein
MFLSLRVSVDSGDNVTQILEHGPLSARVLKAFRTSYLLQSLKVCIRPATRGTRQWREEKGGADEKAEVC